MDIRTRLRFEQALAEIADLRARVTALEGRRLESAPDGLQRRNAARRAEAHRLDEAIADILAMCPDRAALTAKEVGKALERAAFDRVPPERTLRRHLTAVRAVTAIQLIGRQDSR